MNAQREIRRLLKRAIAPSLIACVVIYFAYYAIKGERGLHAYFSLTDEIARTEAALAATRAEREHLERRAQLLSPKRLDPDILDERARLFLGLGRQDEMVIYGLE